jgi:lysine 2,3-aminomutase
MKKIIKSHKDFEKYTKEKNIDQKVLNNFFESNFTIKSPLQYLNKIDWQNPNDPLKLMTIPNVFEKEIKGHEITDPIGDQQHLATNNLVHRYPDRVLLLLTNNCHINCRFCFRKELNHHSSPPNMKKIIEYISNHKEINEIIFSGGDPLSLSPKYIWNICEKLNKIEHIKKIRFHTRIPIVNPSHIDDKYLELFKKISKQKQLTIVLHINHLNELDDENIELFKKLRKSALLLSQTVLLKEVNDNTKILSDLFSNLVNHNIKPYYLHHLDLVKGTSHFRVSIKKGKEIFRSLRGKISGQCIPEYVLDLPEGKGKVPVMWLKKVTLNKKNSNNSKTYQVKNFKGEIITYVDPCKLPHITAKSEVT